MKQSRRILSGCLGVTLLMAVYTAAHGQNVKSASPPDAMASGPSLEETTSWLQDKIVYVGGLSHGYTDSIGKEHTVLSRAKSADFNACRVTIEGDTVEDGRVTTRSSSVTLQDLDETPERRQSDNPGIPGAAFAFGDRQVFSIKFHTTGDKNLVRSQFLPSGMGSELPYFVLAFADQDMADRVAKAMSHAIEVCKTQNPEPF
jgi:hypothetical protein